MGNPKRRPTIQDVARLAAVSPTTVSHMLTGNRPISEDSRQKVAAAIEELAYRPNETARALRSKRTSTIAMIARNITHDSAPRIARGVGDVLRTIGYSVAVYETDSNPETLSGILQSLIHRQVDGVLLFIPGDDESEAQRLEEAGIAYVFIGPSADSTLRADRVRADEVEGIRAATRHVAGATSGRVAFIGGPESDVNHLLRAKGFLEELLRHGVTDPPVISTTYSWEGGRAAMRELLARPERDVTAVVCANDLIAIGAIHEARLQGISVPRDMIVTGFDNITAAAMVSPSLTTVETFEERIGSQAANLLLERLLGSESGPAREILMPIELVVRESAPDTGLQQEARRTSTG